MTLDELFSQLVSEGFWIDLGTYHTKGSPVTFGAKLSRDGFHGDSIWMPPHHHTTPVEALLKAREGWHRLANKK